MKEMYCRYRKRTSALIGKNCFNSRSSFSEDSSENFSAVRQTVSLWIGVCVEFGAALKPKLSVLYLLRVLGACVALRTRGAWQIVLEIWAPCQDFLDLAVLLYCPVLPRTLFAVAVLLQRSYGQLCRRVLRAHVTARPK